MSEKPLSQRIQEGLVTDLVSEIKALERRLAESAGREQSLMLQLAAMGLPPASKTTPHCRPATRKNMDVVAA